MKKIIVFTILTVALFFQSTLTFYGQDVQSKKDIVIKELSPKKSFRIKYDRDEECVFPEGKGRIKLLKGSLGKKIDIDVQRVELSYDKKKFRKFGDVYRLGPHGLKFKKPVLLTLPYEEPDFPEEFIHIYYYNADTETWQLMETVERDTENNTITAKIYHFSDYVPGVGSYKTETGLSPNSSFFRNHNEYVDKTTGKLMINRTDVHIPGRGLDLTVKTVFNSDAFYSHYQEDYDWYIPSEIGTAGTNSFARGWGFKFPRCSGYVSQSNLPLDSQGPNVNYRSEDGVIFNLTNAVHYRLTNTQDTKVVDGYRIYDEVNNWSGDYIDYHYTRVIEIIKLKIVIKCNVSVDCWFVEPSPYEINPTIQRYRNIEVSNFYAYYPDGRFIKFNSSGDVDKIFDATGTNNITFTYDSGKIDTITDSVGRELNFESESGDNLVTSWSSLTLILHVNDKDFTLVKYHCINSKATNSMCVSISYRKHDDSGPMSEVSYIYTISESPEINVTYPYGGQSIYSFTPTSYARKYNEEIYEVETRQKPMVKIHRIRESKNTPDEVTQYTSFNYYNSDKKNLTTYTGINVKVTRVITTLTKPEVGIEPEKYNKIETSYAYDGDNLKGESSNKTYLWNENTGDWSSIPCNAVINSFIEKVSEYYQISTQQYYNGLYVPFFTDYSYKFNYAYDSYGQVIKEMKIKRNGDGSEQTLKETYTDYIYPLNNTGFTTSPFTNDPYTTSNYNALKKYGFGLVRGIVIKQNNTIKQETYFKYDTSEGRRRNLMEIQKVKSIDASGVPEYITTKLEYGPDRPDGNDYNNLVTITDPKENVLRLIYNSSGAYIERDIRTIHMQDRTFDNINIVNQFNYDDLGRMKWKKTFYEIDDGDENYLNHTPLPDYESNYTYYTYDDLNRITAVKTSKTETGDMIPRMTYNYVDQDKYMEAIDAIGNRVKTTYDGLDRVTTQETFKRISTDPDEYKSISMKKFTYHPVFQQKIYETKIHKNANDPENIHTVTTEYDRLGRPIEAYVNTSLVKEIIYDDINNDITEKYYRDDSNFTQKKIDKDWNGNTVQIQEWTAVTPGSVDANIVTNYAYDLAGNCISMTNAAGSTEEETYTYNYNILGKLEEVIYPDGNSETSIYDDNGNLIKQVDRNGNLLEYKYDSINMLRTENTYKVGDHDDPVSTIETDYGQFGAPVSITEKKGTDRSYKYEYVYNSLGELTVFDQYVGTEDNEKHYSIRNDYDDAGNLDTTILREGPATSGNIIRQLDYDPIDPDSLGTPAAVSSVRLLGANNPLLKITNNYWGGISTIEYGVSSSVRTTYGYNNFLQPTSITATNNMMDLHYEYDFQGNVTKWGNGTAIKYYSYDGLDRIEKEADNSDLLTPEAVYSYDNIGNRLGIDTTQIGVFTDADDKEYNYDSVNKMRLIETKTGGTSEWTYKYDANGNLIRKDNGTDKYWYYEYDEKNRLREVLSSRYLISKTVGDGNTLDQGSSGPGSLPDDGESQCIESIITGVNEDAYVTFDAGSEQNTTNYFRVYLSIDSDSGHDIDITRVFSLKGSAPNMRIDHRYDGSEDAIRFYHYDNGSILDYNFEPERDTWYRIEGLYDSVGGIYEWRVDGIAVDSGWIVSPRSDTQYITAGCESDADLHVYADRVAWGTNGWFGEENGDPVYELQGKYFYDASGLMIKKIENGKTTVYIYNGQNILFEETFDTTDQDELGNPDYYDSRKYNILIGGKNLAKFTYTWDGGEWEEAILHYHLLDHLGSRQVVCDSNGDVVTEGIEDGNIEYGTFGEHEGGIEGEYSYTGKQMSSESGLTYFNARWYDPALGRFITMDPIKDGQNWYVYCENNPLRFVDKTGLYTNYGPGYDLTAHKMYFRDLDDRVEGIGGGSGGIGVLLGNFIGFLLGSFNSNPVPQANVPTPPGFRDAGNGRVWSPDTGYISASEAWDTYSNYQEKGRSDRINDSFDDALKNALDNVGSLGDDTLKMYDPETGTLIGEKSADGKKGWRMDDGHINWWDWSEGKKGSGGKYGHEYHPGEQTGPHSEYPGYSNWAY